MTGRVTFLLYKGKAEKSFEGRLEYGQLGLILGTFWVTLGWGHHLP